MQGTPGSLRVHELDKFVDLRAFLEHDTGGRFAAWEEPNACVADLRVALALAQDAR